jgi:hypothetical protein
MMVEKTVVMLAAPKERMMVVQLVGQKVDRKVGLTERWKVVPLVGQSVSQ